MKCCKKKISDSRTELNPEKNAHSLGRDYTPSLGGSTKEQAWFPVASPAPVSSAPPAYTAKYWSIYPKISVVIIFDVISCTFNQKNIIPHFLEEKAKKDQKKKKTPQTLINKSCVFGMALSIRVKISTGLDRVCLPHNETSWVCTKLKFTDNSLSYRCLFQFTNILIKKRVIFCVCYIFSFSLNFLPLTIF